MGSWKTSIARAIRSSSDWMSSLSPRRVRRCPRFACLRRRGGNRLLIIVVILMGPSLGDGGLRARNRRFLSFS